MGESEVPVLKRPIESSCLFTNLENPFSELQIADVSILDSISDRGTCPKCNKSRRYYCYNCYAPVWGVEQRIPKVKLPVKIDIIKHPKEVDGKSTSAHAAVLAPEDIRVFTYPDFPSYENEKVLLIFPGKTAVALKELVLCESDRSCKESLPTFNITAKKDSTCICLDSQTQKYKRDNILTEQQPANSCTFPFDRVVFIDSTWRQTKKLYRDPIINSFPCAVLTSHRSVFWRHQRGKPDCYLSTVEAIYYFLVELHQLQYPTVPYCARYDNLLFFFKFMYFKIRTLYDPAGLRAYRDLVERILQESSAE